MVDPLVGRIVEQIKSQSIHPVRIRRLAKQLDEAGDDGYPAFREAIKKLMHNGR